MGGKSKIEWTNATWTPVRARRAFEPAGNVGKVGWHCEHVSEGCRFCYAESINRRLGTGLDYRPGHLKAAKPNIEVFLDEKMLVAPLRWKRPRMVFVCSMTDLFADFVSDEIIDRIFAVMALTKRHTFQILTKRPERMSRYLSRDDTATRIADVAEEIGGENALSDHGYAAAGFTRDDEGIKDTWTELTDWPLPNIWLGVSVEDQQNARDRIVKLLETPAALRFLSCEPLLGPIDLRKVYSPLGDWYCDTLSGWWADMIGPDGDGKAMWAGPGDPGLEDEKALPKIDWVIAGGESGKGGRPMHPSWPRSLRDQCDAAGVPFFFKQWGEWLPEAQATATTLPWNEKLALHQFDDEIASMRVGKRLAGHLLDGHEHLQFPKVTV